MTGNFIVRYKPVNWCQFTLYIKCNVKTMHLIKNAFNVNKVGYFAKVTLARDITPPILDSF